MRCDVSHNFETYHKKDLRRGAFIGAYPPDFILIRH